MLRAGWHKYAERALLFQLFWRIPVQANNGVILKNADTLSASNTSTKKDSTSMGWHFVELCTEWKYVCCLLSIPAALQVSAPFEKPDIFNRNFPQNGFEIYFVPTQDWRNSENSKSSLQWLEGLGSKTVGEISFRNVKLSLWQKSNPKITYQMSECKLKLLRMEMLELLCISLQ